MNFATFVGQGSIRQAVIGSINRKATPEELDKMKEMAAQAMRDGAFGLSTGLFYVPGNFTPTEEVIELAKVVGKMGGIHISHMREEASHVLDSVRETIRIGEEGGLPTQITHHKMIGQPSWGQSVESLKLVEEARARGRGCDDRSVPVHRVEHRDRGAGAAVGARGRTEVDRRSGWRRRSSGRGSRAAIVQNLKVDRGAGDPKNVAIVNCGFDRTLAGKNLTELTQARGSGADAWRMPPKP